MPWIKPQIMERRQGRRGLVVVLADVSASMSALNKMLADELALVAREIPGLRVFAFAGTVKEVRPHQLHTVDVGHWTNMLLGMQTIARLSPERTIIMSDGEATDISKILHIADQMTGIIDAFYCYRYRLRTLDPSLQSLPEDAYLMHALARCSHGRMATFDIDNPSRTQLREELSRSFFQPQGGNMNRYPDKHIYGDRIDVRRPPDQHINMEQHIHVHHRPIINHHRHEPQHIEHGTAGQQTTYIHGAQITMHQAPDQHQQVTDRGHVVEVRHQHAALPKPGIRMPGARQLALPAPQQASRSNSRHLGLPAPQQQPMQRVSAREMVLATFNQQAKKR